MVKFIIKTHTLRIFLYEIIIWAAGLKLQGCPDLYLEKFQVDFRTKSIFFVKIT